MFNFVLFLMQGIPESVGITGLTLALVGNPLHWNRIMPIGIVMTLIIYLLRLLPITFGLHTVAALLLFTWSIIKTTNTPATKVFIGVFASFAILGICEAAVFDAFLYFTAMDPQEITSNNLLWQVLGMPHAFILILLAILIARLKRPESDA